MGTAASAVQQLKEYDGKKLVSSTKEVCLLFSLTICESAELPADGVKVYSFVSACAMYSKSQIKL
jgi:hypothetical protein